MTPKYEIIHQTILKQIQSGALNPDDPLPGEDELAKEYGVSLITVRRAMTELKQDGAIVRVRGQGSFVKKPESRPAAAAQRAIAFLLSHDNNAAVSITRILSGVMDVLSARGYKLLVEWNVTSGPIQREVMEKMQQLGVEGFLIYPFDPDADARSYEYLERCGAPYVLIDRYPHGRSVEYVGSDNLEGGRAAFKAFASRGHKRLGAVTHLSFLSSERERVMGFRDAAEEGGVAVTVIKDTDAQQLRRTISENGITGLFCISDRVAARTIQKLKASGFDVPGDVSVIGFDDCYFESLAEEAFSSVRQDFRGIGETAAKAILRRMENPAAGRLKTLLRAEMVERPASLAAPKS